jgi:hypothetical protein
MAAASQPVPAVKWSTVIGHGRTILDESEAEDEMPAPSFQKNMRDLPVLSAFSFGASKQSSGSAVPSVTFGLPDPVYEEEEDETRPATGNTKQTAHDSDNETDKFTAVSKHSSGSSSGKKKKKGRR